VGIARDISDYKRTELLLRAQRDLGDGLSQTSDLPIALKHLLDVTMQLGGVDYGGVYLPDPDTGGMYLMAHRGASPAFVRAVSHWAADSSPMRLVRRGRPIFSLYRGLPLPHDDAHRREGLRASGLIPLSHKGKPIGALILASRLADEIPRETQLSLEAIAAQTAGAIARIQGETERRRLERQLLEISDRQQAGIGQEIHDGLCQHLVSLAFDANSLQRQLSGRRRPEAKIAHRIARYLDRAITEARQLSRGLFPARLAATGLPPALEELARTTAARFKLRCRFTSSGPVTVADTASATHLYRIAQEAVANAIRHSQARSVSIRLRADARKLELSVEDDGRGLAVARRKQVPGLGLHIMEYRARAIGGTFRLGRSRRGGTLVSCCVPRRRG
jgi:signal transduction histidine kinase